MPIISALLLGRRLGILLRSASVTLERYYTESGMADGTGRAWCAPQANEASKLKLFNSFTKQKVRNRRAEWLWRAPAGLLLGSSSRHQIQQAQGPPTECAQYQLYLSVPNPIV